MIINDYLPDLLEVYSAENYWKAFVMVFGSEQNDAECDATKSN